MNKNDFLAIFENAISIKDITYIAVKVNQPQGGFEVIIFGRELFNDKYEYYKKAYNDEMRLNTFEKIYISDINFSNDVGDLAKDMFGRY